MKLLNATAIFIVMVFELSSTVSRLLLALCSEIFLASSEDHIGAWYQNRVSYIQDKHDTHFSIPPAPEEDF